MLEKVLEMKFIKGKMFSDMEDKHVFIIIVAKNCFEYLDYFFPEAQHYQK